MWVPRAVLRDVTFLSSPQEFIRRPWVMLDTYEQAPLDPDPKVFDHIEFNHRPFYAHNVSSNTHDDLKRYSSGFYCSAHLEPSMHWMFHAFCPDSPFYREE